MNADLTVKKVSKRIEQMRGVYSKSFICGQNNAKARAIELKLNNI
jgi:hypothetical protein